MTHRPRRCSSSSPTRPPRRWSHSRKRSAPRPMLEAPPTTSPAPDSAAASRRSPHSLDSRPRRGCQPAKSHKRSTTTRRTPTRRCTRSPPAGSPKASMTATTPAGGLPPRYRSANPYLAIPPSWSWPQRSGRPLTTSPWLYTATAPRPRSRPRLGRPARLSCASCASARWAGAPRMAQRRDQNPRPRRVRAAALRRGRHDWSGSPLVFGGARLAFERLIPAAVPSAISAKSSPVVPSTSLCATLNVPASLDIISAGRSVHGTLT